MTYSITKNEQFNSVEISFDGKPSEAVRDALKALRFRWHNVKKVWYGYKDEETVRAAIEGSPAPDTTAAPVVNKWGVQVGDTFSMSWGYDQTNNDFFQVVKVCGKESVRVRQITPRVVNSQSYGFMAERATVEITRELQPALARSVFIKDQERGDVKRIKDFSAAGDSPCLCFDVGIASLCVPGSREIYESDYR